MVLIMMTTSCVAPFFIPINHSRIPANSWRSNTFALMLENEDLLTQAIYEIETQKTKLKREDMNITSISFTSEGELIYRAHKTGDVGLEARPFENEILRSVMELEGVSSISLNENSIDFSLGGRGFGSATSYFGFCYLIGDDLAFAWGGIRHELTQHGEGWIWNETIGGNIYYIEKITGHFYYYELHY